MPKEGEENIIAPPRIPQKTKKETDKVMRPKLLLGYLAPSKGTHMPICTVEILGIKIVFCRTKTAHADAETENGLNKEHGRIADAG